MIFEIFPGIVISASAIVFFIRLKFNSSLHNWIFETSKFIYIIGHPVMDDDMKYKILTRRFKKVFLSFSLVIFKILFLLLFIAAILTTTTAIFSILSGDALPGMQSKELLNSLFPSYLYHWPFIVGTFLPVIFFPMVFKIKKKEKNPYSSIGQLLHYVFLGNSSIAKLLFKIELRIRRNEIKSIQAGQNIYISGLARSGTTALMQTLGQLPHFASLSYRHMPFLFLTGTWPRLSSKKKVKEKERYHKDGMMHSIDSYEALEEAFWRTYDGMDYIKDDSLITYNISEDTHRKYMSFRKLVAKDRVYLAKNNNHLLRAASLHDLDSSLGFITQTIIPFREPYAQAESLLNQHRNLSQLQKADEFFQDYMDFLAHHEFGCSHKVTVFDNETDYELSDDQNRLEYWLDVWFIYYSKVYAHFAEKQGFYFFSYEDFCKKPYHSLTSLASKINLPPEEINNLAIEVFKRKESGETKHRNKYSELYYKLVSLSINHIDG